MSELIIGNGFLGSAVYETFAAEGHDVHQASRRPDASDPYSHFVDLLDLQSIAKVLEEVNPSVIVNTAAILGRNNDHHLLPHNPQFARNLLEGVYTASISPRVVMLGSAAVYGPVEQDNLPISEDAPLNPSLIDLYAVSKKEESRVAHHLAAELGIELVEARVFNPLGPNMHGTYLINVVMDQIRAIQSSQHPKDSIISVRNLEVERDYAHVQDVVDGIGAIAHADSASLLHNVYNVSSGNRTSNETLIQAVLYYSGMPNMSIEATDTTPEPLVGEVQADVSFLRELGWAPRYTLDKTIQSIVAAGLA